MKRLSLLLTACTALAPVARADVVSDSAAITANAAALAAALAALPNRWQVQCTGAYGTDTPAIQAALSAGGTIRIHGACVTNAALVPVSNSVILGDGAANLVASDAATSAGKLKTVAAVGATTSISADPATMHAAPFNIIDLTGSSGTPIDNVWIHGVTISGSYAESGGTVNGPGISSHAGGGIKVGQYGSDVIADAVEVKDVGGAGFDVPNGGVSGGIVNSDIHGVWGNGIYGIHSSFVYALNNYVADASQAVVPISGLTTFDGIDFDPCTNNGVAVGNTVIDDDILGLNYTGGCTQTVYVAANNWISSPNITPDPAGNNGAGGVNVSGPVDQVYFVNNYVTFTKHYGLDVAGDFNAHPFDRQHRQPDHVRLGARDDHRRRQPECGGDLWQRRRCRYCGPQRPSL